MNIDDLACRRVAILGAGLEGRAALEAIGTRVGFEGITLLDEKPIQTGLPVTTRSGPLGELGLADFEVVVRSPGFSIYRPELRLAREAGVVFTSGTSLWLATGPGAPVVAVTGTKGKSTTTSLLAHLLKGAGMTVALGGNIGQPVLSFLGRPAPDWFVVELSSYQLADLTGQVELAVLTSLLADHLDWHGSLEHYHRDKLRLLAMAKRGAVAHTGTREAMARVLGEAARDARIAAWAGSPSSWQLTDREIRFEGRSVAGFEGWRLPGRHNLDNLEVALAAAQLCGADTDAAIRSISEFEPLPHRLQPVPGVTAPACVNDSIATTPDATVAAIGCFPRESQVLIAGGFERQQDWRGLARSLAEAPVAEVVVQGDGGGRLLETLTALAPAQKVVRCGDLAEAVALAFRRCDPSSVILFSPGAPSFDQFENFARRGESFIRLCQEQARPAA